MMSTRARTAAALASVALSALLLTGCAGNPIEQLVGEGVKGAIEGATGVEVDTSTESVPADFPASVPLIDGKVTSGAKMTIAGVGNWTVTKRTDISVSEAFDEVRAQLTGAGLTEGFAQGQAEQAAGMFTGDQHSVLVNVASVDGAAEVTYVVSELKPR